MANKETGPNVRRSYDSFREITPYVNFKNYCRCHTADPASKYILTLLRSETVTAEEVQKELQDILTKGQTNDFVRSLFLVLQGRIILHSLLHII